MFICEECGKQFPYKCRLNTHKTVHSDEKKYQCEKCDHIFKQVGDHNHHSTSCGLPKDTYKCKYEDCSYTSNDLKNYNEHLHTTHGSKDNYSCILCGQKFMYRDATHKHFLKEHPGINIP